MYTTTWDVEPELKSPTDDIFQYIIYIIMLKEAICFSSVNPITHEISLQMFSLLFAIQFSRSNNAV